MGFRWTRPPSQAWNIERYKAAVLQAVAYEMQYWAATIEADMKQNAPWEDQTGNARQSLASFVYRVGDMVILVAKQEMTYGVWLEISHGGKYAIVMTTMDKFYDDVMKSIEEMLR